MWFCDKLEYVVNLLIEEPYGFILLSKASRAPLLGDLPLPLR